MTGKAHCGRPRTRLFVGHLKILGVGSEASLLDGTCYVESLSTRNKSENP